MCNQHRPAAVFCLVRVYKLSVHTPTTLTVRHGVHARNHAIPAAGTCMALTGIWEPYEDTPAPHARVAGPTTALRHRPAQAQQQLPSSRTAARAVSRQPGRTTELRSDGPLQVVTEAENMQQDIRDHTLLTPRSSSRIHAGNHPCVTSDAWIGAPSGERSIACCETDADAQLRFLKRGAWYHGKRHRIGSFKHFCRTATQLPQALGGPTRRMSLTSPAAILATPSRRPCPATSSGCSPCSSLRPSSAGDGLQHVGDLAGHSARIQAREQTQIRRLALHGIRHHALDVVCSESPCH